MKAETFNIINHEIRDNAIKFLMDMPVDGKHKVTFSNIGTKSDRQRGLNWRWNNEIAKSGIGQFDDANDVHREGKLNFAIPILLEEDDLFPHILKRFEELVPGDPIYCGEFNPQWIKFLDRYVKTEDMTTSQVADYMTSFQYYWLMAGVNLTEP